MATYSSCVLSPPACNKSVADIKLHIDKILCFLDSFGWLADVYVSMLDHVYDPTALSDLIEMVDFFVYDYWKKLLPCWRSCFSQMNAPEIAEMLSCKAEKSPRFVRPLSMLAYRQTILSLSLKRTKASDEELANLLPTVLSGTTSQLTTMASVTSDPINMSDIEFRGGQYICLDAHYRKHVKPKKQHEIDQMSKVIGQLCQKIGCEKIVDVGAGLGHLSRLLNFKYGLTVTTVEASSGHAPKAQKYDLDLKIEIKKKKKKMEAMQLTQSDIVQSNESSSSTNFHSSNAKMNPILNNSTEGNDVSISNAAITPTNRIITTRTTDTSSLPYHIVYQVSNTISPQDFLQTLLEKNSKLDEFPVENSIKEFQSSSATTLIDHSSNQFDTSNKDIKVFSSKTKNDDLVTNLSPQVGQNSGFSFSETNDTIKSNSSSLEMVHSSSEFDQEKNAPADKAANDTMVLCGLHACGDLTSTILRMFGQSSHVAAIASVGCCYMKLTGISNEAGQSSESICYPMSQYLLLKQHCLSYEAREMACHFVDAYRKRLIDNCPSLRRHWYRAALQVVLRTVHPNFEHGRIKLTVKNVENLSFETYLEKALKHLGLDINDVPSDILNKCKETQDSWKDVVCFYTTRLSLAPVVETLLLLDRVLHLNELGFGCALVPIFEPILSPRNFLLLAIKPSLS